MKTNISINLTDEERIIIGQRFYKTKGKKKITRADLNVIVKDYVDNILKQTYIQILEKTQDGFMSKDWSSLPSLKSYFEKTQEESVKDFDGFSLTTDKHIYTLTLGRLSRRSI